MFSLIRSGPKILLLETTLENELNDFIISELNGEKSVIGAAFDNAEESYLIIFVVEKLKEIVRNDDIISIYTINNSKEEFFCKIFNSRKSHLITQARMAPRTILMRSFGNTEKIIQAILKDYKATVDTFENIIDNTNDSGTIVTFIEKPINKNASLKDLYGKALFINENYPSLLRSLRMHGLKYVNEGIGKKDWYEIEIRIYDTFSAYDLHYKRLMNVLDSLELGIVLGESWGKDSPRFLMTVGIYRVRFFTFHDPKYIKKILIGLEHLDDGFRIVDYDVYHNRKKIDWMDVAEKNYRSRRLLSKKYREEILSRLEENEKKDFYDLEDKILKSRN